MSHFSERVLYWAPRSPSLAFVVLLSLFALDVFDHQLGFWQTAQALAMHLIPSFVLIGALIVAWRWEWMEAVLYGGAGLLYVYWVVSMSRPISPEVRLNWVLTIAGPAFVIAGLFLANWLNHDELRSGSMPSHSSRA